jgi:hypothetical protein
LFISLILRGSTGSAGTGFIRQLRPGGGEGLLHIFHGGKAAGFLRNAYGCFAAMAYVNGRMQDEKTGAASDGE